MPKKNLIKHSDFDRVLITETLPYETPIIFSNDGLYNRIKNIENTTDFEKKLIKSIVLGDNSSLNYHSTKPYLYKIRKNTLEYRRLALIHQLSQWKLREFYEDYNKLILYFCNISPASIRTPKGIASSFFAKSSWENIYKYQMPSLTSETIDGYAKHAPSFFSYTGYDRLYKFFNSSDYFSLEKKFQVQMTLDVSKCFDSIYTHSIAWATKDKEFIKANIKHKCSSFGDDFDSFIRHGNDNETNGIPIGPEVSRIFAEIIFQKIDQTVIRNLKKRNLEFNEHYAFRRYVDDVYIFAVNEDHVKTIYSIYSDILMKFNLHTNTSKSTLVNRPFTSKKSQLIHGANILINEFFEKFLEKDIDNKLKPKTIYSSWKLTRSFIDSVRNLCGTNEVSYSDLSSFFISSINERIKRLIDIDTEIELGEKIDYFNTLKILLDVLFFLYSVAPSVSSSYKLSTTIILVIRFIRLRLIDHEEEICHKIYNLTIKLLLDESQRQRIEPISGFINLEYINILLSVRELGEDYLIPESVISKIFSNEDSYSYFSVISCLFYIKESRCYNNIRALLIKYIRLQLSDLSDITINSEKAHLLLDVLSCPYIPEKYRKQWVKNIAKKIQLSPLPNDAEAENIINHMAENTWQINWSEIDLLNSLEKKELKRAY